MSDILQNTVSWFQKAVPNPTDKNMRVQLGVHLEEIAELLEEAFTNDHTTMNHLAQTRKWLTYLSNHLKQTSASVVFPDREATLDAICDQLVTGAGLGHMMSMDVVGALDDVNFSNWSKFVDGEPIFDENKKIKKGPMYRKPELSPFI